MNQWYYLSLELQRNSQRNSYEISNESVLQLSPSLLQNRLLEVYQSSYDDTLQDGTSFDVWDTIKMSLLLIDGSEFSSTEMSRSNFDLESTSTSIEEVLYSMYQTLV